MMHKITIFAVVASIFCISTSSNAQVIFLSDLDSEAGWSIVGSDDTAYEFGFDYAPFGIPTSPNGEGSTTGLKMQANITSETSSFISAIPADFSVSGQYQVAVDFWLNYNTS